MGLGREIGPMEPPSRTRIFVPLLWNKRVLEGGPMGPISLPHIFAHCLDIAGRYWPAPAAARDRIIIVATTRWRHLLTSCQRNSGFLRGLPTSKNFLIIFKNRKKFFDKYRNYPQDDAASEKASKIDKNTSPNSHWASIFLLQVIIGSLYINENIDF